MDGEYPESDALDAALPFKRKMDLAARQRSSPGSRRH
jgi:hypothetical protein